MCTVLLLFLTNKVSLVDDHDGTYLPRFNLQKKTWQRYVGLEVSSGPCGKGASKGEMLVRLQP